MWRISFAGFRSSSSSATGGNCRRSTTHLFSLVGVSFQASSSAGRRRSFATLNLKKLIQPFILKCHPDMAAQQGLPKTAVQVNLKAIQNLNSYIDAVIQLEKSSSPAAFPSSSKLVEIEFVMAFSSAHSGPAAAAQPTTSRRRVELQVPPPHLLSMPTKVSRHVQRQVVKLLRMADLPVPKLQVVEEDDDDIANPELDEEYLAGHVVRRGKTAWETGRERFVRRINWTKFDKLYQKALRDAQANLETRGMIRNTPKLRQQLLARILSHVQFTNAVTPLERLVAYRRLLRLLDQHFDYLQLESFGKYWEELQVLVTESRPYNTSSSAMRKRRQRHQETGYRFTIHHDNSVTVQIPVDFSNDELIQELYRNVNDFYEWTQQDDAMGLGGILDEEGDEGVMM